MDQLPESVPALVALLDPPDNPLAAKAMEAITAKKGKRTTRAMADFLKTAPLGLLATRAAMELEKRKDPVCLEALYEVYQTRPELAEDVIPIFSALEDDDAIVLVVGDLRPLMAGPARLSTLAYLVKCADPEALCDLLLPILFMEPIAGASDDIQWAVEQILVNADDETLGHIGETATAVGPAAFAMVEPYLPAKSELEVQAPDIARAFLRELTAQELLEMVPDSEDALVDVLANTICDARSPKGLVRDVERLLIDHTAVDEIFADRNDIRVAFTKVTSG